MWTYRYATHWITTPDELTGYIERFEVTPEQELEIEAGAMPDQVLAIVDPYTPEETAPEVE
jgi:hypothetical protein